MIRIEAKIQGLSKFITLFFLALIFLSCTNQIQQNDFQKRSHSLNKEIMCPVCPGESIDQSQNPLAVQMRSLVVEKIELGWTDGKIKDFFVSRYGPRVLLSPPFEGFGLVVWIIPPIILIVSLIVLAYVLRRMFLRKDLERLTEDFDERQSDYIKRVNMTLETKIELSNIREKTIGD